MLITNKWYFGVLQNGYTIGVFEECEEAEELARKVKNCKMKSVVKIITFMIKEVDEK